MSPFFKFLPFTKFPLQLLYFKSHIRQRPQHLLWTENSYGRSVLDLLAITHNYSSTNRSVIISPTFYVACPFTSFFFALTNSISLKPKHKENEIKRGW